MAKNERTIVYIDGSNLFAMAKALDFTIDYKRLSIYLLETFGDIVRVNYYTAIPPSDQHSPIMPMIDWMDYNGYNVITKTMSQWTSEDGRVKIKGNMDAEMVTDMCLGKDRLDHIVLISGDGDFTYPIERLKDYGIRVTVIGTVRSSPPMISDRLRRSADHYIDLSNIRNYITRIKSQEDVDHASDGSVG